jgi:hypothetical protein
VVATKVEDGTNQRRIDPVSSKESELAASFQTRAREVFGRQDKAQRLAEEDAFRLWLAWRGDPSYLIANLSDRAERESSWRVVRYTEIPELSEGRNHVEARSMGIDFPEHVLARLTQYVLRELDRVPGAEVKVEGSPEGQDEDLPHRAIAERAYGHVKAGRTLTIRWPSKEAPGLFSRIIVLSKDSILDSKYPALDRATSPERESDRGFTKFLERAEKKHQKRWVRWVTHG